MSDQIDPAFLALADPALADAALATAKGLGAEYADFRLERQMLRSARMRNRGLESLVRSDNRGYGVRVIVDGSWGFAAGVVMTPDGVRDAVRRAVALANVIRPLGGRRVQLAPEASYTGDFVSTYTTNPFDISDNELTAWMGSVADAALQPGTLSHVDVSVGTNLDNMYLVTSEGTAVRQQRVRMQAQALGTLVTPAGPETMRTTAPPFGGGWELVTDRYDYLGAASRLAELLPQKVGSPSVTPGRYPLVILPSHLWLTIHESIAHALEYDRILGYEANYAGTSWVPPRGIGTVVYGSPLLNIVADRTTERGLATTGWDCDGVPGQAWDLVRDGILAGYELDRAMAAQLGVPSNGCSYADAPYHVPIQRMPNISLEAGRPGVTVDDLIAMVDGDGFVLVGDNSWSIDMQRRNFQFTPQQAWRIEGGVVVGQVRDLIYQGIGPQFWGSLRAVGGPETWELYGAFNCGKGQPGQVAPVSHGAPAVLVDNVNVLNAKQEGAR